MLGSTGRHAHAVADLDYDAYAEGEAALGWLNQTLVLSSAHDVDIDTGLMRLGHEIHRACGETGAAIAHAKLMLQGSGRTAIVNIVDNTRAAELSRAAATSASALTLTLNLRVQAPPDALQSIVDRAIAAWAAGLAIDVRDRSGRAFSPARPVPTHRIPAADPV
jgi:hypothetical protein